MIDSFFRIIHKNLGTTNRNGFVFDAGLIRDKAITQWVIKWDDEIYEMLKDPITWPGDSDNYAPLGIIDIRTELLDLPESIVFEFVSEELDELDYPHTDVHWPIMSRRMLDALLAVGDFPHQLYPVIMRHKKYPPEMNLGNYYRPELLDGTESHNYFAVQLTSHIDCFDFQNSVYKHSEVIGRDSTKLWIDKLALIEPEGGFPPLFRVATLPARENLYISSAAKTALQEANITGVEFWDAENFYGPKVIR